MWPMEIDARVLGMDQLNNSFRKDSQFKPWKRTIKTSLLWGHAGS